MFLIVKFNVLFIKRQVLGMEGRATLGKVIGMCLVSWGPGGREIRLPDLPLRHIVTHMCGFFTF